MGPAKGFHRRVCSGPGAPSLVTALGQAGFLQSPPRAAGSRGCGESQRPSSTPGETKKHPTGSNLQAQPSVSERLGAQAGGARVQARPRPAPLPPQLRVRATREAALRARAEPAWARLGCARGGGRGAPGGPERRGGRLRGCHRRPGRAEGRAFRPLVRAPAFPARRPEGTRGGRCGGSARGSRPGGRGAGARGAVGGSGRAARAEARGHPEPGGCLLPEASLGRRGPPVRMWVLVPAPHEGLT